jgi:hypothetical protein
VPKLTPLQPLKKNSSRAHASDHALQLKENYERYLQTQAIEMDRVAENVASRGPVANKDPTVPTRSTSRLRSLQRELQTKVVSAAAKKPRTEEERKQQVRFFWFEPLRESYEDALVDKQKPNGLGSIPMMTSRKSMETNSPAPILWQWRM